MAAHIRVRSLALCAVAAASALSLTACGQLSDTNPRLKSIGATGPQADPTETTPPAQAPPQAPDETAGPPPCPPGEFQWEIEQALATIGNYGPITVDGVQSAQDCATIAAFQKRMGIGEWRGRPAGTEAPDGTPGPTTKDVAERIAATDTTACPWSDEPQAFVDLTHQTWLPYWQAFYRGDGLHETTTYIHDMWRGSHGCVNLLREDAKAAYELLGRGSTVHLYGRRPGT